MSENEGNVTLSVAWAFLAGFSKDLLSCFGFKGGDQSWEVGCVLFSVDSDVRLKHDDSGVSSLS